MGFIGLCFTDVSVFSLNKSGQGNSHCPLIGILRSQFSAPCKAEESLLSIIIAVPTPSDASWMASRLLQLQPQRLRGFAWIRLFGLDRLWFWICVWRLAAKNSRQKRCEKLQPTTQLLKNNRSSNTIVAFWFTDLFTSLNCHCATPLPSSQFRRSAVTLFLKEKARSTWNKWSFVSQLFKLIGQLNLPFHFRITE